MGLGKTRRSFVLGCCRYSSLENFEDAFDTALGLMPHCIIRNANKAVWCVIFGRFSNLDHRKQVVTFCLVWLYTMSARMPLQALVNYRLNSTVVELFDSLCSRTSFAHFSVVLIWWFYVKRFSRYSRGWFRIERTNMTKVLVLQYSNCFPI